jgi:hypothetical protein
LPIKQNHSDMVKFPHRWDKSYGLIVSYLEEFIATAPRVIQARFPKEHGKANLLKVIYAFSQDAHIREYQVRQDHSPH